MSIGCGETTGSTLTTLSSETNSDRLLKDHNFPRVFSFVGVNASQVVTTERTTGADPFHQLPRRLNRVKRIVKVNIRSPMLKNFTDPKESVPGTYTVESPIPMDTIGKTKQSLY